MGKRARARFPTHTPLPRERLRRESSPMQKASAENEMALQMAQRLLEYNILATRQHQKHVLSCVIYLRRESAIPQAPLIWRLPDGQTILSFDFFVVKLWELASEELLRPDLVGLLPLLPLTRDGREHRTIETMLERIPIDQQASLLPLAELFAGLVMTTETERLWLKGRFSMFHSLLEESWVYQEILERGQAQGIEQGRQQGIQQALLAIVQKRFPSLLSLAKERSAKLQDLEAIEALLVQLSLAKDEDEARQVLLAV